MASLYKVGYRRLLRSAGVAFRGDGQALSLAKVKLRESFYENRNVSDPTTLQQMSKDVEDIDDMLRFHIVQGVKGNEGRFEVRFTEENKTAIEAEQGKSPFGPELEPIDRGYIGRDVKINHSKTKKSSENAHSCGSSGCKSSH